jgi:hypothetical protein
MRAFTRPAALPDAELPRPAALPDAELPRPAVLPDAELPRPAVLPDAGMLGTRSPAAATPEETATMRLAQELEKQTAMLEKISQASQQTAETNQPMARESTGIAPATSRELGNRTSTADRLATLAP